MGRLSEEDAERLRTAITILMWGLQLMPYADDGEIDAAEAGAFWVSFAASGICRGLGLPKGEQPARDLWKLVTHYNRRGDREIALYFAHHSRREAYRLLAAARRSLRVHGLR